MSVGGTRVGTRTAHNVLMFIPGPFRTPPLGQMDVIRTGLLVKGAWVSHLVPAETLWVPDAVYNRSHAQIVKEASHG